MLQILDRIDKLLFELRGARSVSYFLNFARIPATIKGVSVRRIGDGIILFQRLTVFVARSDPGWAWNVSKNAKHLLP
jgi:hypothetical protein